MTEQDGNDGGGGSSNLSGLDKCFQAPDKCFQVVGKRLVSSDKKQPADDLVIRNLVQFSISVKMMSSSHSISQT